MSEELGPEVIEMDGLLRRTAQAFTYPPTPDLATAVTARLRQPERSPASVLTSWLRRPAVRLAVAGLAVFLAVAGVALGVPQSRTALAEFFGLSHVEVSTEQILPDGAEAPEVFPKDFAERLTLDEARDAADFRLLIPTYPNGIGAPDAVYQQRLADDIVIIFVYEDQGFDLYQSQLQGTFIKGVPEGIVDVQVAGAPGLWVAQGGHVAAYLNPDGALLPRSERSVDRATLLWESDAITYRLETSLSLEAALRIAGSLR